MRISQVVARIHEEASGVSHSVPNLCEVLARCGVDVEMHALAPLPPRRRSYRVSAYPSWRFPSRLGISPLMERGLHQAAQQSDVMHVHSLWMMPSMYPPTSIRGTRCRLVTSPRGTMSTWALRRSRLVKKLFWEMGQKHLLRQTACFHATALSEYDEIRQAGFTAPVAIIPNGVHVPATLPEPRDKDYRRLLFMSRLHPKKGIDLLLRAWKQLEREHPDWQLWVVGPEGHLAGYTRKLTLLAESLGLKRVVFPGPLYGPEKEQMYLDSDLFVLPTHSENFGIVVAEALAHGVPAVVTRNAPWEGLATQRCGWWITLSEAALAESLAEAMSLPDAERRAMGLRGREWIRRDYSWEQAGRMMAEVYQWLVGGGPKPTCVKS